MKRLFLLMLGTLMITFFACSSSPEKTDIESPRETGAMYEDEVAQAPVMSPFTIAVEAQKLDSDTLVTIHLHYVDEIKTQTELHIQFMEDTTISANGTVPYRVEGKDGKLVRSPEAWVEYLPSVAAGTDVTRQLLLAGEHPSLKIVLGLYEEGFSFEMTENWPEPVQLHRQQDARSVLEEPFDVDGISIEKSVHVKPKRHLGDK
jgi:hypothetical protein